MDCPGATEALYHLGPASSGSHTAGYILSEWGVVSMERTRGPGMKPLGLQRPLRIAATFSELLLSLSPTKRDPRTIYLAEYNLGSQTRHNYTTPFFSMPALSSLADIVRPVFSAQKISSPNHLQSPPQGSAVGFNKGAPIPKGQQISGSHL